MRPGRRVASPSSITSAPAGRETLAPASRIRLPSTRISPGAMMCPDSTSSSRAACNTIACSVSPPDPACTAPARPDPATKTAKESAPATTIDHKLWQVSMICGMVARTTRKQERNRRLGTQDLSGQGAPASFLTPRSQQQPNRKCDSSQRHRRSNRAVVSYAGSHQKCNSRSNESRK
jgi:hypothetical protein